VSGAPSADDLSGMLQAAGFEQIVVELKPKSREYIKEWLPGSGCEDFVCAADVTAVKPGGTKSK